MAQDSFQDNLWPLPKFLFRARFGTYNGSALFQEVSGLDIETQPLEYRQVNSLFNMPSLVKNGNVTLKRGFFVNDNNFYNWYETIKMNTVKRESIEVELINETGNLVMNWTLTNAWPTKIIFTHSEADTAEIAVEILELCHEGLTLKYGF